MPLPVAKQHQPHVAAAPCSQAVLACTESNFFNFKLEYLRENEFLSGAQMGWIHEKNRGRKSRDTAPLTGSNGLGQQVPKRRRQKHISDFSKKNLAAPKGVKNIKKIVWLVPRKTMFRKLKLNSNTVKSLTHTVLPVE